MLPPSCSREPFLSHIHPSGLAPTAPAVKVMVWPAFTDSSAGWAVISGSRTVKLATVLVTLPNELLTTQRYAEASAPRTLPIVSRGVSEPKRLVVSVKGTPFFSHWKARGDWPAARISNEAVVSG